MDYILSKKLDLFEKMEKMAKIGRRCKICCRKHKIVTFLEKFSESCQVDKIPVVAGSCFALIQTELDDFSLAEVA